MSIAIIIPDSWEPGELVRWSSTLARSKDEHLLVIRAKRLAGRGKRRKTLLEAATDRSPLMEAIREHAGDFVPADHRDPRYQRGPKSKALGTEPVPRSIFLIELDHAEVAPGVLKAVKALRVVLLIVPRRQGVRIRGDESELHRQLFTEVPCEILQLRPGKRFTKSRESILVATDGRQQAASPMNLGAALGKVDDSQVSAVYVRQDANAMARKKRNRATERRTRKPPRTESEPAPLRLTADVPDEVQDCGAGTRQDMLVVGSGDHLTDDRQIRARVPEQLLAEVCDSTIVVVRGALPLRGRLIRTIEDRKRSLVPQLDRDGRIEVVRRLQSSAEWDFDFLILIFLATLLAALGLVVDSPPVVIGAMLVAPLMSPMLGIGMSVVQGNRHMADKCLGTVGRGFLLAFATGCIVGIVRMLFASGITQEMSNRGAPNVLDLAIAFVSGMVAAYAFGRPHLLSVLPGIAIASSLVPPVAASGLSLIAFNFDVAIGAILLFLSNFVAIVLGSAFTLWVVGMRGPREVNPFTEWAQRWMLGFFAVAVCLAVFFSFKSDGSELRAALVALDDKPAAQSPAGTAPNAAPQAAAPQNATSLSAAQEPAAQPPVANAQSAAPAAVAPPRPAAQQPAAAPAAAGENVHVAHRPVAATPQPNQPSEPAQAGAGDPTKPTAAPPPSVTVVIPQESRSDRPNASVQIEGLPSEDVAELLGEVLSEAQGHNGSRGTTVLIIAIGLVAIAYMGWRSRAQQ